MLLFPAERIALRQVRNAELSQQEQHLSPMVHPVRGEMNDRAAVRFFCRRIVKMIDAQLVESTVVNDPSSNLLKLGSDGVESCEQPVDRSSARVGPGVFPHRDAGDEVGPDLHVANHVLKRAAERSMADVELTIEFVIRQAPTAKQQFASRPGVVAEQTIEQVHQVCSAS